MADPDPRPPLGPLFSVACPSTTVCTAIGETSFIHGSPAITSTSDGGTTWTTEQVPTGIFGLGGGLSDIACAYPGACTAVGVATLNGPGVVIATNNAGLTWATESRASGAFGSSVWGLVSVSGCLYCSRRGRFGYAIIIGQAPITAVLIPSQSTTVSGVQLLDAGSFEPGWRGIGQLRDHRRHVDRPDHLGFYPHDLRLARTVGHDDCPQRHLQTSERGDRHRARHRHECPDLHHREQPATDDVLCSIPSGGATVSGDSELLDASGSIATNVEFRLFGGIYGYSRPGSLQDHTDTTTDGCASWKHNDGARRLLRPSV